MNFNWISQSSIYYLWIFIVLVSWCIYIYHLSCSLQERKEKNCKLLVSIEHYEHISNRLWYYDFIVPKYLKVMGEYFSIFNILIWTKSFFFVILNFDCNQRRLQLEVFFIIIVSVVCFPCLVLWCAFMPNDEKVKEKYETH